MGGTSRISREAYVRFCESLGVKSPGATRREETCPWESDCGPAAKAPDEPPTPYRLRASPRLYTVAAQIPI